MQTLQNSSWVIGLHLKEADRKVVFFAFETPNALSPGWSFLPMKRPLWQGSPRASVSNTEAEDDKKDALGQRESST